VWLQADISGKVFADEAAGLYERATTTMLKNCTLLYFAYADFEEVRQLFMVEIKSVDSLQQCQKILILSILL